MFYHGSLLKMNIGDFIYPNPNGYTNDISVSELENLFEELRPNHCKYSRRECVYLCDNEFDIDNAGGYTDFIYSIDLEDKTFEVSDMSWYSKASMQLGEGDYKGAKESAVKYWSGEILDNVLEYRTNKAFITNII